MNLEEKEPPIETERLLLQRVSPEEARMLLAGEAPPGLVFGEGYPGEFSLEVMDILAGARVQDAIDFSPWFIIRKQEGDVIGDIGFSYPHGRQRPTAGYDIVEPLWGRGYASEAFRGLIGYLFKLPEVEAVEADTFETHIASRRVMEKAGLTHVDTRRQVVDGEEGRLVFYEIRRSNQ